VDVQLDRHSGAPVNPREIEKQLRAEAGDVHGWSNGPGDRYEQHAHAYHKLLYCTHGSIDFILDDGRTLTLRPGDRLVVPAGTRHAALVGPTGCTCVEGKG
jgi:quercetin dioxygenase-like cupin family protein